MCELNENFKQLSETIQLIVGQVEWHPRENNESSQTDQEVVFNIVFSDHCNGDNIYN